MKRIICILPLAICLFLFGCVKNKEQPSEKHSLQSEEKSRDTTRRENTIKSKISEFDINRFKSEADSLLGTLKDEKYFLELKSDTFNFKTDNPETFTKGHGIFWLLYRDSSESIVRHYLFEPNTKKKLRIYLIEADYKKEKHLEQVISNLETVMNDSINAPDSEYFTKWRLSPTNDYILTSDKKLFWLNMSYLYSNNEVLKFIDCLKSNVDTSLFKGRIICLFGSDCKNINAP